MSNAAGGEEKRFAPTWITARTSTWHGWRPSGTLGGRPALYSASLPITKKSALPSNSQLISANWDEGGQVQERTAWSEKAVASSLVTGSVTPTTVGEPTTVPVPPVEKGTRWWAPGGNSASIAFSERPLILRPVTSVPNCAISSARTHVP